MELIIDKLKKIEALARSGVGGERETAQRMLDALCKKHGITLDQIASPETSDYFFTVKDKLESGLLDQIVMHICKTMNIRNFYRGRKRGFALTRLQAIDVEDCYKHYRKVYAKERKRVMNDLTVAFIHKYKLYCAETDDGKGKEKSECDMDQVARIVALIRGMKSQPWEGRKRLS